MLKRVEEEEIDRIKSELVAAVSHELRTPLTTIKELISIISDEIPGKLNDDQKKYLNIIRGNIDRLARLISDILDISKIENGGIELKKKLVDIIALAEAVISVFKPEIKKKNLEFESFSPQGKIDVYADPDKIAQVFSHLIGNAIKFTPQDGKIAVEIKDGNLEVEIVVSDTGRGIAQEDMGGLFTKFQQFDRAAGGGAKGTGLGLAITRELVERHNGRIWAESKLGEGSKFSFIFPKYIAESLLKEHVDGGIKKAMEMDSSLSLVVVSFLDFDKLKIKMNGEATDFILKDAEDLLRNSLRTVEGDAVIRCIDSIAVVLAECGKENACRVEVRLRNILKNYLSRRELIKDVEFRFGCATYPGDAQDVESFIDKARQF